ncbi:MAG: response regulator transcription factor [Acidobacteriota bacterium]
MERQKILVVDDDRKIVDSIRIYFERAGYQVAAAYDGREALREARSNSYHLIVLDLMMPEIDGLDVCRVLRAESSVPIIMLTARTTEEDKLRGLDLGADDYVAKPFSPRELVARARAVLRRAFASSAQEQKEIRRGDLVIDTESREVRIRDRRVTLTPTEFDLLATLARSPGRVFTRRELVERALGWDYEGLERTVDAHIKNLRRKLDDARSSPIATVFGVGYKFFTGDER